MRHNENLVTFALIRDVSRRTEAEQIYKNIKAICDIEKIYGNKMILVEQLGKLLEENGASNTEISTKLSMILVDLVSSRLIRQVCHKHGWVNPAMNRSKK